MLENTEVSFVNIIFPYFQLQTNEVKVYLQTK